MLESACNTFLYFGFLTLLATSASAQQDDVMLELANQPEFTERFAGNTQVNGQFLSGLAYASSLNKLDLKQLRLSYSHPLDATANSVCVRITSDDGRYWASNLYRAKGSFNIAPRVPIPTSYEEQLKAYDASSLLVLAMFSENCNEASGKTYVPGMLGDKKEDAELIASVNVSQSKVSATLSDADGNIVQKVKCKKPDGGAKVTFSHLCRIPANAITKQGDYKLAIGVRGLTGMATEQEYAVHLE
ncbi:hypothetical protein [Mesorhizobium sp. A556]